ncbi:MAG: rod shape-determining protein MreC [Bilifractor sp.]|jgi:rod shape-determining protein MreC
MNKKKKSRIKNRHLLVILSFLCIAAIVLTLTSIVPVEPLQNAAGVIITPIQNGINSVGNWVRDRGKVFGDVKELKEENEQLKEKVASLEETNTTLSMNQDELERLRSLYQLDSDYSQYKKIGANVIAKDPGNWYSSFTINKGTDDGVAVDMNVVTGDGLVGIVTSVGKNWANVQSIIDDGANVSGMTSSTLDTCIVSGDLSLMDQNLLSFSQMHTSNDISEGEKIVTSNISDKYLEGILIGYVDTVEDDSNHLTKTGYIIPAVDFSHLQEVLVITQLKETGGDE